MVTGYHLSDFTETRHICPGSSGTFYSVLADPCKCISAFRLDSPPHFQFPPIFSVSVSELRFSNLNSDQESMASEEQARSNNGERSTGTMVFFPVFVGVVQAEPLPAGVAGPVVPERFVLLNPFTQMMQLLDGAMGSDDAMEMVMSSSFAEDRKGPPPASKKSIEELRVVEVAEDEERECSICLESLWGQKQQGEEESRGEGDENKEGVVIKEMPCRHRFHGGCIDKWLGMHGSCPVCRYMMPEEAEGEAKKGEERQESRAGNEGRLGGGAAGITFTIRFGRREDDVSSRQEETDGGQQQ